MSHPDFARDIAIAELRTWISEHVTNAIGQEHVWQGAHVALNAFEHVLSIEAVERWGYAVMDGDIPLAVFRTRRQAKHHRRSLNTRDGWRGLRIQPTVVHE